MYGDARYASAGLAHGLPGESGQELPPHTLLAPPPSGHEPLAAADDAEARGLLASVQLPTVSAPQLSSWCSVSNLVAIALAPRERPTGLEANATAPAAGGVCQILIVEPSNPEDVTSLELPLTGPGDHITHLEWSWPGQRRALLAATASGRVVVWTQPSQQGQDDLVSPRTIDDWHGQLLLDLTPAAAVTANTAAAGAATAAGGSSAHHTSSQQTVPHVKLEVGAGAAADGVGALPDGGAGVDGAGTSAAPAGAAAGAVSGAAFAGVCWLRQPQGGRTWSTSSLALKRLNPGPLAALGPGAAAFASAAAAAAAQGGGVTTQESLDMVFYDDAPVGAVPHWARPHQLTAAVLTSTGQLVVLWALASKLSNTLSWQRSRPVLVPPPDAAAAKALSAAAAALAAPQGTGEGLLTPAGLAAAKAAGVADAAEAEAAAGTWRVATAAMAATVDGGMLAAVVYGARREAMFMFAMRGNPTLGGQPVSAGPGAPGATATSGAAAPPREVAQPVVALQAAVAMPPGLAVAQTRLHVPGGNAPRHVYVLATTISQHTTGHNHNHRSQANGPAGAQPGEPQQQVAGVVCFADATPPTAASAAQPGGGATSSASPPSVGGGGHWKLERQWMRPHTLHAVGAASIGSGGSAGGLENGGGSGAGTSGGGGGGAWGSCGQLLLSGDGSKLLAAAGRHVTVLDAETLGVLSDVDLLADADDGAQGREPVVPNGLGAGTPAAAEPPGAAVAVASTVCLSANACCMCIAAVLRPLHPPAATAAGGASGVADGMDLDADEAAGDGAATATAAAAVLVLRTVPDFVPPALHGPVANGGGRAGHGHPPSHGHRHQHQHAGGGPEEVMAVSMDTLRLAWGVLQRQSLWDVAERLRCAWLGGRRAGVSVALAQLDGLLYGVEDAALRSSLQPGVCRAKLEVLRRLPHPRAGLVAGDLLASARVAQYAAALVLVQGQTAEAMQQPETRLMAAHMVWFVLEVATLMLSGVLLWAEEMEAKMKEGYVDPVAGTGGGAAAGGDQAAAAAVAAAAAAAGGGADTTGSADGWGGGWEAAGTGGGGGCDCLPLIRLFSDYNLQKTLQSVLLGYASAPAGSKQTAPGLLQLAPMQELLGADVANRAKIVLTVMSRLHTSASKAVLAHVQALQQQAQQQAQQAPGAAPPPPPAGLLPALADTPLTASDLEAAKAGEMPRSLMHTVLQSRYAGPFHVPVARSKGVPTIASMLQFVRAADMPAARNVVAQSRDALLARYRLLGLQQQLEDPRSAPAGAARRLAMSFRAPAPPPELHAHVLTHHVSNRQRQRWRRQRGSALALGSSAPLWSHAQGVPVDCLTGAPLPPGASWSLEGAAAAGAVTAQMGPGVGAAGQRRGLPPLVAGVQRAWVCCAPPAELCSGWKRARLGLEQDLEY
ncbi:hypothetical protein HYH02_003120 [Chlamydomonas schloesseri]|uniref:Uncharacterized protein n=1 Tax=Chlamydomonas schloesseri TaxID=2026947 RepID=A0A835WQ91_9CHLO|nr:hypothetical protein HYH02_003120 [Chlamydomonas schloesseri]|eukprot:KAG2452084.1 hypothetical protein HYH02_003120 [Chlamydomonas schloesseri]